MRAPTYDLDGATIITLTVENPEATAVDFGYATSGTVPTTGSETGSMVELAIAFVGIGLFLVLGAAAAACCHERRPSRPRGRSAAADGLFVRRSGVGDDLGRRRTDDGGDRT